MSENGPLTSAFIQKRTYGPSLNRIFLSVPCPDSHGASFHLFGFLATSGFMEQGGVVLQTRGHMWMLWSEGKTGPGPPGGPSVVP